MKILNVDQGTPEWFAARLGKPTASEFSKIISPQGKTSKQYNEYLRLLLTEWMAGEPFEKWNGSKHMEHGKQTEDEAALAYELETGVVAQKVGFILNDAETYGCSPDRLIGEDGGLEIKCHSPWEHVSLLCDDEMPEKYIPQVQGALFITGRKWWDWMSYHPKFDPLIVRVYPDEGFHKTLNMLLENFNFNLDILKNKMKERGYI